ncbi:bifunctional aspartate kinase/homoserine dehydrogenase I [Tunicatimonas pelagia]|uniref:bifunctional aspartate kinase/homoserine dehydrogenase I n=1 Tax=Tunicatimonas pelagia TaxID=931531 RepID=UPI0026658732|nr:bifunctional aspartate kinase/homoserine dehydrogenase I [Tunicatimonas pelagia]WKN46006.1 bifunctional aspartate kinase/homoserine dehydrogenase I [Tunicatimonas pelagia]
MKVLKFGGTSVGSAKSIKIVADIILQYQQQQMHCATVVSAMGGVTDRLLDISQEAAQGNEEYKERLSELEKHHFTAARELIGVHAQSKVFARLKTLFNELDDLVHGVYLLRERSPRTMDLVLSFGERLSAYLISQYLNELGARAEFLDAREIIVTDKTFNNAKVDFTATNQKIQDYFRDHEALQIVTGFVAATPEQETTTLGRGGSDYTASILGAALNAEEIEIWTDVDGVMTADPRQVSTAFSLDAISYIEAMEMSHFGAKVIYPPTLLPVLGANIPLRIRNTFHREFPGTLVSKNPYASTVHQALNNAKAPAVKGISSIKEVAMLTLEGSGMVGTPGISSRLFGALAQRGINIIIITQASSEHTITFAVSPADAEAAQRTMSEEFANEIAAGKIIPPVAERNLSIVAIVGENMRQTPGISGRLFIALGRNGVNVRAIAQGSSEANLSVVIAQRNLHKALNTVHEAFFLSEKKTLNVFLVGIGLIGKTLLQQIAQQREYLQKNRILEISVIGIANSKRMAFSETGLNPGEWQSTLEQVGEEADMQAFVQRMKEMNMPNSVFVDCTASQDVTEYYAEVLQSAISIVTPNKLANSGSHQAYQQLQMAARQAGVQFLYETNVGASLPVIRVIQDLKDSGDKIYKIEGILSGTLSYLFNTFTSEKRFSDIVRQAKELGYTEPNPREDLLGTDVARKILILAREVGIPLELQDVEVENMLPPACMEANSPEEFLKALEAADGDFTQRLRQAEEQSEKLRFVATLEDERATVRLLSVGADHPFYALSGSDNIISFTTSRYRDRPLVVKGSGAGAEVTAAGVFADLISVSNYLYQ